MQYRLRLSFLEAVHGVEKDLNFQFQTAVNGRAKVETRETKVTWMALAWQCSFLAYPRIEAHTRSYSLPLSKETLPRRQTVPAFGLNLA